MEDNVKKEATSTSLPYQAWWEPQFDSTTNFSMLAWFVGRLYFQSGPEERVDVNLDS